MRRIQRSARNRRRKPPSVPESSRLRRPKLGTVAAFGLLQEEEPPAGARGATQRRDLPAFFPNGRSRRAKGSDRLLGRLHRGNRIQPPNPTYLSPPRDRSDGRSSNAAATSCPCGAANP